MHIHNSKTGTSGRQDGHQKHFLKFLDNLRILLGGALLGLAIIQLFGLHGSVEQLIAGATGAAVVMLAVKAFHLD